MKKNAIKKTLFVLAVTLGLLLNANAQSSTALSSRVLKIKFGAKAGLNISKMKVIYEGDTQDSKSRTSFHIGLVAEIPIFDKITFQPELVYSAQGNEIPEFGTKYEVDYLNLPLMVKYAITENLSAELGPQISFLLSAKEIDEDDDHFEGFNIKEYFKGTDFGINLGVGYTYKNISFDARYTLGLSEIINDKGLQDFFRDDQLSFKNRVFQISVGYFFN